MLEQHIYVNTAVVMFSIVDWELQVLLIKRVKDPFAWYWYLPWWYLTDDKSAEQIVSEKLQLKVGLRNIYLEQFQTFTDPQRDPRYRAITIWYLSIGDYHDIKKYSHYGEVAFHSVRTLQKIAFDHREIVKKAYSVLRYKLFHSNIAQFFLPKTFTLTQLQEVYDAILATKSDTRNFRKYIDKTGIIKNTGKKETNVSHRPALLYEFVHKDVRVEDYGF